MTSARLTRRVRLALTNGHLSAASSTAWTNNWVGGPTTDWLVPQIELNITIADVIDARTGYIEDITVIDQLVRHVLLDWERWPERPPDAADWLREFVALWLARYPRSGAVQQIELVISPQWSLSVLQEDSPMLIVTRQYEFSAAHRLHANELTADENRALYGKCNRPHGHGHNYLLDVCITGELVGGADMLLPAATMDQIVRERVLSRLDHSFLNREVDPFRELNPTVENIARTIWDWLDGSFSPGRLQRIRLYETAKTWVDVDRAGLPSAQ